MSSASVGRDASGSCSSHAILRSRARCPGGETAPVANLDLRHRRCLCRGHLVPSAYSAPACASRCGEKPRTCTEYSSRTAGWLAAQRSQNTRPSVALADAPGVSCDVPGAQCIHTLCVLQSKYRRYASALAMPAPDPRPRPRPRPLI